VDESKKKPLDSISKPGEPMAQPVVETVAPHAASSSPESTMLSEAPKEESFETMFPEPGVAISTPPSWIWWLVLLILSVVLGIVGYALARNRIDGWLSVASPTPTVKATPVSTPSSSPSIIPSPTPSAISTPTPSSSPSTSITLRVLNGTTVAGAASKVQTILKSAGFTVRTIGNAKTQDYASTYVYYQAGKLDQANKVAAALTTYSVTVQESSLAAPDMVLVVIGKK
jgi:LytR cell envelope-related transcriptional attenuator